jgi:hypothetical protein
MSRTFHHKSVKRSRKRRRCTWCAKSIEIGQPYESYRWVADGEAGTVRIHPECLAARDRVAKEAGGDFCWSPGDFERGIIE